MGAGSRREREGKRRNGKTKGEGKSKGIESEERVREKEGRLTLMCSWNRDADWLRPVLGPTRNVCVLAIASVLLRTPVASPASIASKKYARALRCVRFAEITGDRPSQLAYEIKLMLSRVS